MPTGENSGAGRVDLVAASRAAKLRIAWTHQSEDLNVNLIVLTAGQEIEAHCNHEVDVLLVGIEGEGSVVVDGEPHRFRTGQAIMIPKGARRGMRGDGSRFAYLTCHGRRRGMRPQQPGR